MRVWIIAVGRLKSGPESDLAADYVKRAQALGRNAGIKEIRTVELAESAAATPALRKAAEARAIAGVGPQGSYRIVLDERGAALSSDAFAAMLRKHCDEGTADLAFIIGGPDGHEVSTLSAAQHKLSLGPMTWPHRLVRVMLVEQIYREVTIMVNHHYHRP